METLFIKVIFYFFLILVVLRVFNMATGAWERKSTINVYAADTVTDGLLLIWAAFVLWY